MKKIERIEQSAEGDKAGGRRQRKNAGFRSRIEIWRDREGLLGKTMKCRQRSEVSVSVDFENFPFPCA